MSRTVSEFPATEAQGAPVIPALAMPEMRLVERALAIRMFEQKLLALFGEGRLFGTVHTCIGQEWTGVALAEHLRADDVVFSNHRCHGHYLARTGNFVGLFAEIMGREAGICRGRGGSQHICDANVFSNGIQGGIVPVSAGIAWAQKRRGSGALTTVFIGDGTLGEGALYETMNLASKWELPLLIVNENNLYAQSTSQTETLSGDIEARAAAFGIRTGRADTWDPLRLVEAMGEATEYVRGHCRPMFLRVDTYRLMAHSKSDDHRDTAEVEQYWERDFLKRASVAFPEKMAKLEASLGAMLESAVQTAEASPMSSGLEPETTEATTEWTETEFAGGERVVSRIYAGLRKGLERNSEVFLLGEDIEGPYGGAFKVTRDLSQLFPGRVRNTPISELAITGMANGMALAGMRPVVEIMFGDFLMLAADQIVNHASKFAYMYAEQVKTPMVLRTPMGGKRGYGPTHSQSLEKHILGIPGTRVLAVHPRQDPAVLYERLLSDSVPALPTIVIENKVMYGEKVSADAVEGFKWYQNGDDFPLSYMRAEGRPDCVIVCYGGMLTEAEKAVDTLFEKHDVVAEILCVQQLYPLQVASMLPVVQRSGRALVVEEGHGFCGFTAEVAAALHEADERLRVKRLYSRAQHIPSAKPLEMQVLPGADHIVNSMLEWVNG